MKSNMTQHYYHIFEEGCLFAPISVSSTYLNNHVRYHISNKDKSLIMAVQVVIEYAIKKVQVIQDRLKLNGTHQLSVYANDVNLLNQNINNKNQHTYLCYKQVKRLVSRKLKSICSCLVTRLKDKIIILPSKIWQISNTWERWKKRILSFLLHLKTQVLKYNLKCSFVWVLNVFSRKLL
jgi:hypothetical protein